MIRNIIDHRDRRYRWKRVTAVIEATEHDNTCPDADEAPEAEPSVVIDYEERECLSVEEAVLWAHLALCPVTLYLYDLGRGISREEHFAKVANRFP